MIRVKETVRIIWTNSSTLCLRHRPREGLGVAKVTWLTAVQHGDYECRLQGQRAWFWVPVYYLLPVQPLCFSYLICKVLVVTALIGLLWRVSELLYLKHVAQRLTHSKQYISVYYSCYSQHLGLSPDYLTLGLVFFSFPWILFCQDLLGI